MFFLLAGTIVGEQQEEFELPIALRAEAGQPPQNALFLDREGRVAYLGRPGSLAEVVPALLLAAGNGRGGGGIVVVADRRLTATRLVDILQVLRKSGATEISLVTIKGEGG